MSNQNGNVSEHPCKSVPFEDDFGWGFRVKRPGENMKSVYVKLKPKGKQAAKELEELHGGQDSQ
ncbi:MAG: hypothetical protein OXQ90_07715 [Gammaproteobacteria bacterium]|nr:hypothetical protein [Gammaproteobacteria bacterium]